MCTWKHIRQFLKIRHSSKGRDFYFCLKLCHLAKQFQENTLFVLGIVSHATKSFKYMHAVFILCVQPSSISSYTNTVLLMCNLPGVDCDCILPWLSHLSKIQPAFSPLNCNPINSNPGGCHYMANRYGWWLLRGRRHGSGFPYCTNQ